MSDVEGALEQALQDAVTEKAGGLTRENLGVCSGCGKGFDPETPLWHADPPVDYEDEAGTRTLADVASAGYRSSHHHPGCNDKCLFCRTPGTSQAFKEGFNEYFQNMPDAREILKNRNWKELPS